MIGGEDHDGVLPVAVLFDPVGDDFEGGFPAFDSTDGVVEIIVVVGPVDIAGFDHQPESFFVLTEHIEG